MYSWNTIRTVCAILLLIPIIHLAYLVSRETLATLDTSHEAWAGEIAEYAAADRAMKLPVEPIVVIGGRQVKLWQGLDHLLSPRPVLMRGLGQATVDDIIHYHSELIGYYRPAAVVLLPGPSEFHIRDNKSAQELVTAIRKLVELDESYRATRRYYLFTPVKTPLYPQDYATIDEATLLLERWAQQQPQVTILDANPLLTLGNGNPNPDFFRLDGTNLNEHGYLRISVLLQNALKRDETGAYAAH
ncbi:MAG: hypothetical protein OEV88_06510 [Gammaproteobacteria bacterium]|jgi:hypothetical protein|nr:hypothetical protein [Gammaproteobacteria bacterium]